MWLAVIGECDWAYIGEHDWAEIGVQLYPQSDTLVPNYNSNYLQDMVVLGSIWHFILSIPFVRDEHSSKKSPVHSLSNLCLSSIQSPNTTQNKTAKSSSKDYQKAIEELLLQVRWLSQYADWPPKKAHMKKDPCVSHPP